MTQLARIASSVCLTALEPDTRRAPSCFLDHGNTSDHFPETKRVQRPAVDDRSSDASSSSRMPID